MHWTTIFLIGCIVLGGTFRLGYELGRPAKHAIEQLIAESYKQGYIAGGIEILNASCELCNGYPMTADCNNGNCHTNKEV